MLNNAHNSLIVPPPTKCTGNRREAFLFVFNSFACTCRNVAAGRDVTIHLKTNKMTLNQFYNRLFPAFERELTDVVFQFIQHNDSLMKDYLDTVSEEVSLQHVNSEIAKAIESRYGLIATENRNMPPNYSNLIQGYTELTRPQSI